MSDTMNRMWSSLWPEPKYTVLCHPDVADRTRQQVEQAGLDDIVTVNASAFVPADQMYVIDEQAIDAWRRETLGRLSFR